MRMTKTDEFIKCSCILVLWRCKVLGPLLLNRKLDYFHLSVVATLCFAAMLLNNLFWRCVTRLSHHTCHSNVRFSIFWSWNIHSLGSCDRASWAKCEERESQQDATIRCLLSTSVSTCFRHHYAHLQENKDRVLLRMVYCAGSAGCGW